MLTLPLAHATDYSTSVDAPKQLLVWAQEPASYEIAADPHMLERAGFDGGILAASLFEPNDQSADCTPFPYSQLSTAACGSNPACVKCRQKRWLMTSVFKNDNTMRMSSFMRDAANLRSLSSQYPFWANSFAMIKANTDSTTLDLFDNATWANVAQNAMTAAAVANYAGLRGVFIDTENYDGLPQLFNCSEQRRLFPANAARTFGECKFYARLRGQQLAAGISQAYPNITIIFSWTSAPQEGPATEKTKYGLLPSFIDGFIDAAGQRATLVDGLEFSYYSKVGSSPNNNYPDLAQARAWQDNFAAQQSANPSAYAAKMQASLAIWPNYRCTTSLLKPDNGCYYAPADLETSLRARLKLVDKYAWVFINGVNLRDGTGISDEYKQALLNAHNDVAGNQRPIMPPQPPEPESAIEGEPWVYLLPMATDPDTMTAAKTGYWNPIAGATSTVHEALDYAVSGLPQGARYDAATRSVYWTPPTGAAGKHLFVVTASDGYASTSQTVAVNVDPAPVRLDYATTRGKAKQILYWGATPLSWDALKNPHAIERLGYDGAVLETAAMAVLSSSVACAICRFEDAATNDDSDAAWCPLYCGRAGPSGLVFSDQQLTDAQLARFEPMWGNLSLLAQDNAFWANSFVKVRADSYNVKYKLLNPATSQYDTVTAGLDFFNDTQWEAVAHNAGVIAAETRDAGMAGIFFDTEPYAAASNWDWNSAETGANKLNQKYSGRPGAGKTYEEYRVQARQRGRQVMAAIAAEFPNASIGFTILASGVRVSTTLANRLDTAHKANDGYALLPDFVDGFIDAAPPSTYLFDGFEVSYMSRYDAQYGYFKSNLSSAFWPTGPVPRDIYYYQTFFNDAAAASQDQNGYAAKMRHGEAVWIDSPGLQCYIIPAMQYCKYTGACAASYKYGDSPTTAGTACINCVNAKANEYTGGACRRGDLSGDRDSVQWNDTAILTDAIRDRTKLADRYVWVYNQQAHPLYGDSLPYDYRAAMYNARIDDNNGLPPQLPNGLPIQAQATVGQQATIALPQPASPNKYPIPGGFVYDAAAYEVSSLPSGLYYNPAMRAITGIPASAGTYMAIVTATDGYKRTDKPIRISISPAPTAIPTPTATPTPTTAPTPTPITTPVPTHVLQVNRGWNMVSNPASNAPLISEACGKYLYAYDAAAKVYHSGSALLPEAGYWLYDDKACTITLTGGLSRQYPQQLAAGWNLIPGPETRMPVDSLRGNCILTGLPWWYDGSVYQRAATLEPGKAYWVKARAACTMQPAASPVTGQATAAGVLIQKIIDVLSG